MKLLFTALAFLLSFSVIGQVENIEIISRDFNNKLPITVSNYDNEDVAFMNGNSSTTTLFENALFKNGFNIISNSVAVERANVSNTYNSDSQKILYDTKSTTYYSSVYLIKLDIAWYKMKGREFRPDVLSGSVIDLVNEGKIVATFEFRKEKEF